MKRCRIAVASPSQFFRSALERLLIADRRFAFQGVTGRGGELLESLSAWQLDVLVVALGLSDMSGVELIREVMQESPITIVVVDSLHDTLRREQSMEALHAGAVEIIDKEQIDLLDPDRLQEQLIERLARLADANVNARNINQSSGFGAAPANLTTSGLFRRIDRQTRTEPYELVLMGASTGGPSAIQSILEELDRGEDGISVPVVLVQHMPSGFTRAFAERLNERLRVPVAEAIPGAMLKPGHVYVAPAGQHTRLRCDDAGVCFFELAASRGESSHCPSVNALFESVAASPRLARRTVALLLTGMGNDGAQGLLRLEKTGAHTIAQDQSTCVVFGMPAAAIECRAACEVLPLAFMGERLQELLQTRALRVT